MRVFAVWEPMLATDWLPPSRFVLRRLPDLRVRQYWDRDHALARRMLADERPPQPEQECCERNGNLWDLAAVYPPSTRWTDRLPAATVFNGPVVDVVEPVEAAVTRSAIRGATPR